MSREALLEYLEGSREGYVSGEKLSRDLLVTRAAVWKGIEALRKEGYEIEARQGLGYRLLFAPEVLTEREIKSRLGSVETVGSRVVCLATVDSTNSYLKREAVKGEKEGLVAVAEEQTAGRGRLGRVFESVHRGLYLSILLRPPMAPEKMLPLTGLAAVAARRAILSGCGLETKIKWTNDLLLGGKKVCGILTEMALEGESGALQYAVVGIGINVNQLPENFSPEVRKIAGSLREAAGQSFSRAALGACLIRELDRLYAALKSDAYGEYIEEYRENCVTLNKEVRLMNREPPGRAYALDVDDRFGLIVRAPDGSVETLRSGEVSVRGLGGYSD